MMADARPTTFGTVPLPIMTSASGLAFLQGMIAGHHPAPHFSRSTDIWLTHAEAGHVLFEAAPSQDFLNPLGTIHGGWISALIDSAMACAVHSTLQQGFGYSTIDMSVSFVRAVLPTTGKLICEGNVVHSGGRIATAEGRVRDAGGVLYAHGTETCLIMKIPAA